MTDEKLESAEEQQESAAPPMPKISDASPVEPSSAPSDKALMSRIEQLETTVRDIPQAIEKMFQSAKDTRFGKLEPLIEATPDLLRLKQYVDAAGGDWAKGYREMQLDDMIAERESRSPARDPGRSTAAEEEAMKDQTEVILKRGGIPYDDPELAKLATQNFESRADWYKAISDMADNRIKQASGPNPASVVTEGSGQLPPSLTDDELLNKIQELQATDPLGEQKKELLAKAKERGIM